MEQKNRITDITRRSISDEMILSSLWYHGSLTEPDFLARLFDLHNLPSKDHRYRNAYEDIYQHMVNNTDWDYDWLYNDTRINLSYCDDNTYLKFLELTLHPRVRQDETEIHKLVEIYNKHLEKDGFEVFVSSEISGKPIFAARHKTIGQAELFAKKVEIKKYLNTKYVNGKIDIMNDAIHKDTDLAIVTAKELLQTTCKSILKQKAVPVDPNWALPQLLKTTTNALDFTPKEATNPENAEKSIKQILGGISSIVHGVANLEIVMEQDMGKMLISRYWRLNMQS